MKIPQAQEPSRNPGAKNKKNGITGWETQINGNHPLGKLRAYRSLFGGDPILRANLWAHICSMKDDSRDPKMFGYEQHVNITYEGKGLGSSYNFP